MDTLQDLNRKIKSAKDLLTVVRTMKSLAASNIHQYEKAVNSLQYYYRAVELGFLAMLLNHTFSIDEPESKSMVAFIFGSDQGLVGQFNDRIIDFARRVLAGRDHRKQDISFWVAGAKTADIVEESFGGYEELFLLPSSVDTITTNVQEAVLKFEARRGEYGETGLTLFYNMPVDGSLYKQEMRPLLSPDKAWLSNLEIGRWPGRSLPFYRTAWSEIFPALIGEYLFVSLFHGYAASMSAENAARLSSMHRAEKNTREMIEDLIFRHNSLRQEKIDEELLEVVSGFEALRPEEQW